MNHHPNFEICAALTKLPDGSFSGTDLQNQEKIPWGDRPPINAKPGRIKFCPWCERHLPIEKFIVEGGLARTISRPLSNGDWIAYVCADVREWCDVCEERRRTSAPVESGVESF